MQIFSFPPISSPVSRILILGSMPGNRSLEENKYYAHPRNQFWKIMFALFNHPFTDDYDERKQFISDHYLAIWDVSKACIREGSLDVNIREEVPNDFTTFFMQHPAISTVAFNGQKAAQLFHKHIKPKPGLKYLTLPSTSPAHAGITFEQKLLEWSCIFN